MGGSPKFFASFKPVGWATKDIAQKDQSGHLINMRITDRMEILLGNNF